MTLDLATMPEMSTWLTPVIFGALFAWLTPVISAVLIVWFGFFIMDKMLGFVGGLFHGDMGWGMTEKEMMAARKEGGLDAIRTVAKNKSMRDLEDL